MTFHSGSIIVRVMTFDILSFNASGQKGILDNSTIMSEMLSSPEERSTSSISFTGCSRHVFLCNRISKSSGSVGCLTELKLDLVQSDEVALTHSCFGNPIGGATNRTESEKDGFHER